MVYADYNATYPVLREHVAQVLALLESSSAANPSSIHSHGRKAKDLLETARGQVASCLHVLPQEILFTSGATESNNMVIHFWRLKRLPRCRQPG